MKHIVLLMLIITFIWANANEDWIRDVAIGNIQRHKRSVTNAATNKKISLYRAARNFAAYQGNSYRLGRVGNKKLVNSCLPAKTTNRCRYQRCSRRVSYPRYYRGYSRNRFGASAISSSARAQGNNLNSNNSNNRIIVQNSGYITVTRLSTTTTQAPITPGIQLNNRDVVFVLDTSGSIPSDQFEIAKNAVSILVESLCPVSFGYELSESGNKQISVVLFGRTQTTEIEFSESGAGLGYLQEKILSMEHRAEGATATTDALKYVRENVLGKGDSRLHNPIVATDVIVITDGQCNVNCGKLGEEADKLRLLGHGVNVFALGVANARQCELQIISGEGSWLSYGLGDFNSLEKFAEAVQKIAASSDKRCA